MNTSPPLSAARRPVVLLVEDEVGIRDAFALLLELEGYTVRIAVDGQDALDAMARGAVDLVLTDYMMPRMNGLDLALLLRERLGAACPPLIMITAACDTAELSAASDVVLVKPFEVARLLHAVRSLLRTD